jgi:hypothetical protein
MEASFRFGMAILVNEKGFLGIRWGVSLDCWKGRSWAGFTEIAKETYR